MFIKLLTSDLDDDRIYKDNLIKACSLILAEPIPPKYEGNIDDLVIPNVDGYGREIESVIKNYYLGSSLFALKHLHELYRIWFDYNKANIPLSFEQATEAIHSESLTQLHEFNIRLKLNHLEERCNAIQLELDKHKGNTLAFRERLEELLGLAFIDLAHLGVNSQYYFEGCGVDDLMSLVEQNLNKAHKALDKGDTDVTDHIETVQHSLMGLADLCALDPLRCIEPHFREGFREEIRGRCIVQYLLVPCLRRWGDAPAYKVHLLGLSPEVLRDVIKHLRRVCPDNPDTTFKKEPEVTIERLHRFEKYIEILIDRHTIKEIPTNGL